MATEYEFDSPEEEAAALSLLTQEERIRFRQKQYGARLAARERALREEVETRIAKLEAERIEAKHRMKMRQAANRAARMAENQRIRSDRNSNRK